MENIYKKDEFTYYLLPTEDEYDGQYVVYWKQGCMYSDYAVKMLSELHNKPIFVVFDIMYLKEEHRDIYDQILKLTDGIEKWPKVFLGSEFIGGSDDLKKHLKLE